MAIYASPSDSDEHYYSMILLFNAPVMGFKLWHQFLRSIQKQFSSYIGQFMVENYNEKHSVFLNENS